MLGEGNTGTNVMRTGLIFGAALAGALVAALIAGRDDKKDDGPESRVYSQPREYPTPYQPVSGATLPPAAVRSSSAGLYPLPGSGTGGYPDSLDTPVQGRVATYPQPGSVDRRAFPEHGYDPAYLYPGERPGSGGVQSANQEAWTRSPDMQPRTARSPMNYGPASAPDSRDEGYNPWVGASPAGRPGYPPSPEALGYPGELYDPYGGRERQGNVTGPGGRSVAPPPGYPGYGAWAPYSGTGMYSPAYGGLGSPMPPIFPFYGAGTGLLPVW